MYAGIQTVLLGIVVYKLSAMGLLPAAAADYVDLIQPFDVRYTTNRPSKSWPEDELDT